MNLSLVSLLVGFTIAIVNKLSLCPPTLPGDFLRLDVATRLSAEPEATSAAATDFGRMTHVAPAAVLRPATEHDIAELVRSSYLSTERPFTVAARGRGHSTRGQAGAAGGVVVEMRAMAGGEGRIKVVNDGAAPYVDAGGEQLWKDVLQATLQHGLAPVSWTDYLQLTVGGTLSVAGVSGQASRRGPQISNVYQLDVVTGKGEMVTCSKDHNEDLFLAVLGGLGQFGVITRARIALEPAPQRTRWLRLMYTDFAKFTKDQEDLISDSARGFDYVEGSLFLGQNPINSWRSSFFSEADLKRINALASLHPSGMLYCLEVAMYYRTSDAGPTADEEVDALLRGLSFVPTFVFSNDVKYVSFLDRVHDGEMRLRSKGLWDVPHPWFNIFVPRSSIHDFHMGVFQGGILKHQEPMGPILIYPLNRTKWDLRMSAVIPEEEEVFYSVGLLRSAVGEWERMENQNAEIVRFCEQRGIKMKQYMPRYGTRREWIKHFGDKWELFFERKNKYDPKAILSPGQGIFSSPLVDQLVYEE